MKKQYLEEELIAYAKNDVYPFHMPGHKRNIHMQTDPYAYDITEIEGFDNLHQAQGILREGMERLSRLYQTKKSYYLINGSTCGILSAIAAVTKKGDDILVARNSHKAVYHAIELGELKPIYLYPAITSWGIQGSITPKAVREALAEYPNAKAVVVTSPTYDGVLSDIHAIAEEVHRAGAVLIVDEAHGAHLKFADWLPQSALECEADIVIQSLHKTLPAMTQTAVLHINSNRISQERVEKYLQIYQTSSPSYVLMASIDRCVRMLEEGKERLFSEYQSMLKQFYASVKTLKQLTVLRKEDFSSEEAYDFDVSKILITTHHANLSGTEIMKSLREDYQIETEMATGHYVLAMTSIMDTSEALEKLSKSLRNMDNSVEYVDKKDATALVRSLYGKKKQKSTFFSVDNLTHQCVSLSEATGHVAGATITIYPPGIPMILPGEIIEEALIKGIEQCIEEGLCVTGIGNLSNPRIDIVNF